MTRASPTPYPPDPAVFAARRRPERDADGAVVVDLRGDLDACGVPVLSRVVEEALAEGDAVLDLGVVGFVALAGLDALAALAVSARHQQRRLRVARCSRTVARTATLATQIGVRLDVDGLPRGHAPA